MFVLFLLKILIRSIKTRKIFDIKFVFLVFFCSISESLHEDTSLRIIPNWLGTFSTTAECDIQKCCCIYGLITLSKVKPNYLQFVSLLEGYNCPINRQIYSIITMPTGFKTEFILATDPVDITLSADSHIIKLYHQKAPVCNESALRNNARSIIPINQIKMVLMILIIFLIFIQKTQ